MLLLAIETATSNGNAIIINIKNNGQESVLHEINVPENEHAISFLPPRLNEILPTLPLIPTAIITNRGPGSFTGIRVGLSSAQGLSLGLGVPMVTVSSLQAIAWRDKTTMPHLAAPGKTSHSYFQQLFAEDFLTPLGEATTEPGSISSTQVSAQDLINVAIALHQQGLAWEDAAFNDPMPLYIRPCYTVTNKSSK